jgi:hypothetical protein
MEQMQHGAIVWEPRLLARGVLHGVRLDVNFATACANVPQSAADKEHMVSVLWSMLKPENNKLTHVPSDMFVMHEQTLLVTAIYLRHSSSGQSLNLADGQWWKKETATGPLMYAYHQRGRQTDADSNQWLQYAFSRWVSFARQRLWEQPMAPKVVTLREV